MAAWGASSLKSYGGTISRSAYGATIPSRQANYDDMIVVPTDDVTVENLHEVYEIAQANANDEYSTLMIFDDVQKYFKGQNEKFLLHMINNRRHARLSLWFACQTYNSIPRQVRQGITDMFVFKINKTEMENIFMEQIEQHKERFIEILKFVFQKNHDFMYLNTNSQRLFSNWNELLIES